MSVETAYRPQQQELQQFTFQKIDTLDMFPNKFQPIFFENHDILSQQMVTNPFYERYPGYVEQHFGELIQGSRTKMSDSYLPNLDYAKQIAEIDAIREELYTISPEDRPKVGEREDRSYDIVYDVWRSRELQRQTSQLPFEEKTKKWQEYSKYLEMQNRTFLGEYANVYDTTTTYTFRNGVMYMDALSQTTPFEKIIAFGVVMAEHDKSVDILEEKEELKGIIQMGEFGKFAKDGETYVLISSTGQHPDTKYKKNYIDIGKKIINPKTGEIQLEVTRFKAPHTSAEYTQITLEANKEYLNGFNPDTMSERGWRLSHFIYPEKNRDIVSAHQLYDTMFQRNSDAISEADFMQKIYIDCFPLVKAYLHLICNDASWQEIVEAHCAVIAKAEVLIRNNKNEQSIALNYSPNDFINDDWQLGIAMASLADRNHWGKQEITGGAGGCGSVKGYGMFGKGIGSSYMSTLIESLSMNNLVQLGLEGLEGSTRGCEDCNNENSDNHYHCPGCNKKYADETNSTHRTEKCGCGFRFHCGSNSSENAQKKIETVIFDRSNDVKEKVAKKKINTEPLIKKEKIEMEEDYEEDLNK